MDKQTSAAAIFQFYCKLKLHYETIYLIKTLQQFINNSRQFPANAVSGRPARSPAATAAGSPIWAGRAAQKPMLGPRRPP